MKLVIFSSAETALEPRLFSKVGRSAAAAGWNVILIAQYKHPEVRNGINIKPVPMWRSRLARFILGAPITFLKALKEKTDIYQFSDPELIPFALLLQFLANRPVVYDLREYHAERIMEKFWIPGPLKVPLAGAYDLMERLAMKLLAGVVAVNADLAQKRRNGPVAVVPNYPPKDFIAAVSSGSSSQIGARYQGRRVILFLGGISQDRGALVAVHAMVKVKQHVPDAVLVFVGPVHEPAFEQELRKAIGLLGVENVVELIGLVPYEEVVSYLQIANVGLTLLQSSTHRHAKAEPIKFFEYAAAGIPQVVSDLPALHRLVERIGNGILVDASDENQVAEAMIRLLLDQDLATSMGQRGREAVLSEYNWEAAFTRLHALYKQIIQR